MNESYVKSAIDRLHHFHLFFLLFQIYVKGALLDIGRFKASFLSNSIVNQIYLFNIFQFYDLSHADPHCQQL